MRKIECYEDDAGVIHRTEEAARQGDTWEAWQTRVEVFCEDSPTTSRDRDELEDWLKDKEGIAALLRLMSGPVPEI